MVRELQREYRKKLREMITPKMGMITRMENFFIRGPMIREPTSIMIVAMEAMSCTWLAV